MNKNNTQKPQPKGSREYLSTILVFSLFTLASILITYPLIFKFNSAIYGYPGDSTATIWHFWWYKYAWLNNISPDFVSIVGAPFGWDLGNAPIAIFLDYAGFLLTMLNNEIFAYNIILFLTFPISAISMYFLVKYFTKSQPASLVSGLIYMLSPYHLYHSYGHIGMMVSFQWLPIYVLSIFRLDKDRTFKNVLFSSFAFALVTLSNYYDGFFIGIFTVIFISFKIVWNIFKNKKIVFDFKVIKMITISCFLIILFVFPFSYKVFFTASKEPTTYARSFEDLYTYSARIWDYFLPSVNNPIFGKYTATFIMANIHNSSPVEQAGYLGFTPLLLGIFAFWQWKKNRKQNQINSFFDMAVPFFVFALFAIILVSAPPIINIGPFKIPMPSYFFYKILPMFRAYVRIGVLATLSLCVLAGIGVNYLLAKISSKILASTIILLIITFTSIEFINIPPFRVTDLSVTPPVYIWLAKQKGNYTIAEYPLYSNIEAGNSDYLFYQRIHKKKLFNGIPFGTKNDKIRESLADIGSPLTPGGLKFFKVKFVILHLNSYKNVILDTKQLKLVKKFKNNLIYEITTKPAKALLLFNKGFLGSEQWADKQNWRWIDNNAEVNLKNLARNTNQKITIEFFATSFHKPRTVKISINNRIIKIIKVTTEKNMFKLTNLNIKPGDNIIKFQATPGSVKIGQIIGNSDERLVSVAFSGFKIAEQ